jgi:hypothetical protein
MTNESMHIREHMVVHSMRLTTQHVTGVTFNVIVQGTIWPGRMLFNPVIMMLRTQLDREVFTTKEITNV